MKAKILILLTSLLILNIYSVPVSAQNSETTILLFKNNDIVSTQPRADDIRWRYKTKNGIVYKRQYNYSKERWVGKWIRA